MPWHQTDPMTERTKMIVEYLSGDYGVAELARRHGVSRKSAYKWIVRHWEESWPGLEERSRAAHHHPNALGAELEEAILALKARWPDWGAPKLRHKLLLAVGAQACPAESTVSGVLERHGLVKVRGVRGHAVPGGAGPLAHCTGPNAVWCVDFKAGGAPATGGVANRSR